MDYLWVGLGGFLGANARYALGAWIIQRAGESFPLHTLVINVTGSLAIGVLLVLLTERLVVDPAWRLLLVVGFLGGYTTFSAASLATVRLIEQRRWSLALASSLGMLFGATGAAALGFLAGRAL